MSGERDLREVTGPTPPAHVAIIMDGNGRWAKSRGLPRIAGHRRGAESVRRAITASAELGISYLTLFGFSSENWKRPSDEVNDLMALLRHYLRGEIAELHQQGVRLLVIGDRVRLAPDIVTLIDNAEQLTRNNKGLTLIVALSYGGRDDIVQASRKLAEDVAAGRIQAKDIDETRLSSSLFTAGIPDPELLIRTSGEQRISNFLLWQLAYTELVFIETLWPDFGRADLEQAIAEFGCRDRRYGTSVGSR